MSDRHGSAVVVGASIGGLLNARALSAHFDQITIVDAIGYPRSPPSGKACRSRLMLRVLARRAPQGAGTPWGVFKPPQLASQV